jgi:molybdopterin biosynthesis enzyme
VGAIAGTLEQFVGKGVSLILAAGVNSTDPLDLTIQALDRAGARTERRGVPAHPGSTCWLAYCGHVPVFGLALCGMFSRTTVLDLLLPRFLSGKAVDAENIAALGHGGLLNKDMAFRFPAYQSDAPGPALDEGSEPEAAPVRSLADGK